MLGNTINFFVVIVTLASFVASTDISADNDSEGVSIKEEQILTDHGQSGLNTHLQETDVNSDEDEDLSALVNEDGAIEESFAKNKNKDQRQRQKSPEDTHEILKKFKHRNKPLWKVRGNLGQKQEPGFDLTPEEIIKFNIWEGGVIPYYIDVVSFSDKVLRDRIRNYLQMVNSAAGLNFVELLSPPSDENERWVFFINRRGLLGCADHSVRNFTTRGVQLVLLGYDCIASRGEIAEAVMSIVGVPAQHNAPDRHKYIQVNMENIKPDKRYLFEKLTDNEWLFHDLDYDFNSITHYDIFEYSTDGQPTIQPKFDSIDLGLAKELSPDDLLKIKMLYSYIGRNKKLKSTECEKLFKPRSKFERFVLYDRHIKPRKKPSRYIGLQQHLYLEMGFRHRNDSAILQNLINAKNALKERFQTEQYVDTTTKNYHETQRFSKPHNKIGKSKVLTILSDYNSE